MLQKVGGKKITKIPAIYPNHQKTFYKIDQWKLKNNEEARGLEDQQMAVYNKMTKYLTVFYVLNLVPEDAGKLTPFHWLEVAWSTALRTTPSAASPFCLRKCSISWSSSRSLQASSLLRPDDGCRRLAGGSVPATRIRWTVATAITAPRAAPAITSVEWCLWSVIRLMAVKMAYRTHIICPRKTRGNLRYKMQ